MRRSTREEDQILFVPFEEIHGDQGEQEETRSLPGTLGFLIAARILETGQSPPKFHAIHRSMGTPSPDNSFTWSKGLWWGSGGLENNSEMYSGSVEPEERFAQVPGGGVVDDSQKLR